VATRTSRRVVKRLRRWQVVEDRVADRLAGCGELDEQPRGCAVAQPDEDGGRVVHAGQRLDERLEVGRRAAVGSGEQVGQAQRQDATGAAVVAVEHGGSAAAGAVVGDLDAGAFPADRGVGLIPGNQRLDVAAAGAAARV